MILIVVSITSQLSLPVVVNLYCSIGNTPNDLDHQVLAVGYGTQVQL